MTDAAVRNYQRANGLTVDGIVGPITWNHLMQRCGFASASITPAAAADILEQYDVAEEMENTKIENFDTEHLLFLYLLKTMCKH